MNLNDYPTPRTTGARRVCLDKSCPKYVVPAETSEQLEREAAAWRDVAEYAITCLNQAARDEGKPMSMRSASTAGLAKLSRELFDRLLAETNSEPSGQRSASADVEP